MRKATLAIITRNKRTLLGEKKTGEIGRGTLNGPGGKFEVGIDTDLMACVIRETEEEIRIRLLASQLTKIAIITFFVADEVLFEVHVFRTGTYEGEPEETADMIPSWHDNDSLPFNRMLEGDTKWFKKAVDGEKFNANVYYREKVSGFERIEFFPFEDTELAA